MTYTEQLRDKIFHEHLDSVYRQRDRVFARLMAAQWVFGVILALVVSPYGWDGKTQSTHIHVYYAVFVGGALSGPTILLTIYRPGSAITRHSMAVAQMLWSALLIHLTGGRIETHFHVFGSLAFLAFYRDWKVLLTATLVVSGDHLLRGLLWPESVYGIINPEWWRFLEHAFWVVFENVVLVMAILESHREMGVLAARQIDLEERVAERTSELQTSLRQLEEAQEQLVTTARAAGMAEIAVGVLHNVGNVLNSVNVSAQMAAKMLRGARIAGLQKGLDLMKEHQADLSRFMGSEKGQLLPDYLARTTAQIAETVGQAGTELESLQSNVEHIKTIIAAQQTYARSTGHSEMFHLADAVQTTLRMSEASLARASIAVVKKLDELPQLQTDKHKLIQILVNLIGNARHAVQAMPEDRRTIEIVAAPALEDRIRIEVRDNGVGIAPEIMPKLFRHGFTTRENGHGFGLHSSANAAKELGGSLSASSEGLGRGATFLLEIPSTMPRIAASKA